MSNFNFNRDSRACLIGYYAAIAGVGLMAGVLGPTLSFLAVNTHTTLKGVSLIFVAFPVGYILGAVLTGRLLDRIHGHPIIGSAALVCSLTLFLSPLMNSLVFLSLVMGLMGFAEAGLDVGGNTLLGWVYRDKVGPYMNALHFFFGVGAIAAPLVVAQSLNRTGGITWAYWLLALLMLPIGVWIIQVPSPPHIHTHADYKPIPLNRPILALFVLFFLFYSGMELGYGNWVFNYAKGLGLADDIRAAYLTSLFWGALTVGRLVGIPIAARVKPVTILAADVAGCAVSVAAVLFWPHVSWVLWAGTAGAGYSMASIFPTLMTFAGQSMSLTGKTNSFFFIGASSGAILFPWLIGQCFESMGPRVMVEVTLADIFLIAVVFFFLKLGTVKTSGK